MTTWHDKSETGEVRDEDGSVLDTLASEILRADEAVNSEGLPASHTNITARINGEDVDVAGELEAFALKPYIRAHQRRDDTLGWIFRAANVRGTKVPPGRNVAGYAYRTGTVSEMDAADGPAWEYLPSKGSTPVRHYMWLNFADVSTMDPDVERFVRSAVESGITGLTLIFEVDGEKHWQYGVRKSGSEWIKDQTKVQPVLLPRPPYWTEGTLNLGSFVGYRTHHEEDGAEIERKRYLRLRGILRTYATTSAAQEPDVDDVAMSAIDEAVSDL